MIVVVNDWPGVPDRISVVPGIVVKDPSGSVKVEGRIIVVKDWPGVSDKVSVVPRIVLREPSDSVVTDGDSVITVLNG